MSSIEKITVSRLQGSENYITWSIRIKAALAKDSISLKNKNLSAQANIKALSIIQLLVANSPLLHIKDYTKAYKAWEALKDLYNPKGFTIEFLVYKEFFETLLTNFDSIEAYLNKVKELLNILKLYEI